MRGKTKKAICTNFSSASKTKNYTKKRLVLGFKTYGFFGFFFVGGLGLVLTPIGVKTKSFAAPYPCPPP
jgi:hypothetical protein